MSRFLNKLALVTGAGSGLGEAITARFVKDGARVIAADITGRQNEVARRLGSSVVPQHVDVSDPQSVGELFAWIREREELPLRIVANNAGIGPAPSPFHEIPLAHYDQIMAINARGAFVVQQHSIRAMLESGKGGAIVNTVSIGGQRATPYSAPYLMSKGAALMMTRCAALEYAKQGIRVNAIGPGVTHTPLLDGLGEDYMQALRDQVPQGRLGRPEDMANVVAFLADDEETSHVNGQMWVIDGGRSAG